MRRELSASGMSCRHSRLPSPSAAAHNTARDKGSRAALTSARSLIDVQFAPGKDKHDVAQQVLLLAKPGDTYVFSGTVTNIDLRSGTLALENRSDEQTYELHFDQSAVDDRSKLKVGSEVTAHAVFNGSSTTRMICNCRQHGPPTPANRKSSSPTKGEILSESLLRNSVDERRQGNTSAAGRII